ncbi:MAG: hypothetical protein MJ244_02800 [Clostridia bacterium]|nr:hypothetical protein [Clostridia bacterium]
MNLLFAGCGLLLGFIAGVGVHALTSYKEKEKLQEENAELKRQLNMSNKCRQIID